MFKTDSKPLAHLNFLSGDNCYDIGSRFLGVVLLHIIVGLFCKLIIDDVICYDDNKAAALI
jgi:hypothetical protein